MLILLIELLILFVIRFILLICVKVGVAFLTLLERKLLGYIHIRKGPNKVGFIGILEPFSDAIVLLRNRPFLYYKVFWLIILPSFLDYLALLTWIIIPYFSGLYSINQSIFFICR
ncbi:NADH-ubiquinone oxidoreductase chain 1 [Blattella germanica]|nr:NADH-ubiquinone oxidoreductase chain 1 [Blattella germanica]